jgi:hypothetical protein
LAFNPIHQKEENEYGAETGDWEQKLANDPPQE